MSNHDDVRELERRYMEDLLALQSKLDSANKVIEQQKAALADIDRLKKIEHHSWHLLDDSCEDDFVENEILKADYHALCALLPEDHPDTQLSEATK